MKDSFRKLAESIRGRPEGAVSDIEATQLSNVLEEHLDMISAAHTNGHYNVHHSHPKLPEHEG